MSTVPYTEKGPEAQGGDPPGQVISWMGGQGGAFSWQEGTGWHVCFPSYLPPPNPGAHPSAYSTRHITPSLQFPVPTHMCRQHLWVGYQPDPGVGTDLCLSVSQAGTPTTGQVLSASGTALQGQLLRLRPRLPKSSDRRVGKVTSLPGPCSLLQRLSFIP